MRHVCGTMARFPGGSVRKQEMFRRRSVAAVLATWLLATAALAQQPQGEVVESGKWKLYKFEQAIGAESYEIRRESDSLVMTDNFEFTDRGSTVPLQTTFRAAPDLTPRAF